MAIEAQPPTPRRVGAAWLVLYPVAWVALSSGSHIFWFLPAGLRLGLLWILPRRAWWKMALVEWATILAIALVQDSFDSPAALGLATVLPWCIYALVLRAIGDHDRNLPAHQSLPRLLACGVLAALFTTVTLTTIELGDKGVLPTGLAGRLVSYAVGDFAGVVMVLPVLLLLRDQFGSEPRRWVELFAHGLVLAPLAVALGLSSLPLVEAPVYPLALALFPMFAISYRFGWRQCTIALVLLAAGVYFLRDLLAMIWGPGQLQMLVAATGCAALLLGVASDNQRAQRQALSATVQTLSLRGIQLVEAANRIASLQEQERRRIGAELHDQIGQDMTAIATRLRVVERTAVEPVVREGLASIGQLVSGAHSHLREVINQLHPAVLDRFGLARALSEGPFAEMLYDHDIDFNTTIEGDVDSLPDNVASALYRICQEATTNCAKHGCGGRVHIRLGLVSNAVGAALKMEIEDDAGALRIDPRQPGRGLQNIHDRAHAIGAEYRFDPDSGRPRHAVQLWLPKPFGPGPLPD